MITSQKLIAEVKTENIYPVYLLMGEEREDKRELIGLIIKNLNKKSGNVEKYIFYGDEIEVSEVLNELQTYSFFDYTKVVIIKNVEKLTLNSAFFSYLENPNDRSVLILLTDNNDISKRLQRSVEKVGRVVTFWKSFQNEIENWLLSELKIREINADIDAVRYIIEITGNQKEDLLNQLNTISNYIEKGETLDTDKLKKIISRIIKYTVFDLINSIFLKYPLDLIKIFRTLIENGEDITKINYFMWKYLKTLMIASSYKNKGYSNGKIISILKLRKLESSRVIKIISNVPINFLNKLMDRLEKIDYLVKTQPKYISILQFERFLLSIKKI